MKTNSNSTTGQELVALRKKKMKDGGYSLYLDYTIKGIRKREFLKMYLVAGNGPIVSAQNTETMKIAMALKAKRTIEVEEGIAGLRRFHDDTPLSEYLREQIKEYTSLGKHSYVKSIHNLSRFINAYRKKATLESIDKEYIVGLIRFMRDSGLSESTLNMYFALLNTMMNNALREGRVLENPIIRVERKFRPKAPNGEREYLTMDELHALADTPCADDELKRAFLFACFTGLRISDIQALDWENIKRAGDGWQIQHRQIKTGNIVYVPLSENAISMLPSPALDAGKVFSLLSERQIGRRLKQWTAAAGIQKHITFHCSRHTYATLLLTYGADVYTVSKLLGHTNVATTQIYAKIVDEKKRQAVNLIPSL